MRRRWIGWWHSGVTGCVSRTPTTSCSSAANRDPQSRYGAAAMVLRTHVRMLLASAGTTGDLDSQTDALLALLEADYIEHQLIERGHTSADAGRCVGKPGAQALRTMKPRWILHVDLDQFLASVELGRHPELVGLPVIVGGNGDPTEARKVVTCASYEAREFGVHAGMPLRAAARRCPGGDLPAVGSRGVRRGL